MPYLLNHLNSFINKFHSNVVNLGPRVFMACPLGNSASELETWFLSLWNHFIIPYLMGTIMAGIEVGVAWVGPADIGGCGMDGASRHGGGCGVGVADRHRGGMAIPA